MLKHITFTCFYSLFQIFIKYTRNGTMGIPAIPWKTEALSGHHGSGESGGHWGPGNPGKPSCLVFKE